MTTRRNFFKIIGAGAAWMMAPRSPLSASGQPEGSPVAAETPFSVVRGRDIEAITRKAVEAVGGMGRFVERGDVVFVKPNISWDKKPEQAATTNPLVVATIVSMVREAGAGKVIVADNACNDARRTYKRSGIREAAEKAGAEVPFMEKRKFEMKDLGGEVIGKWEVYRDVEEADKIINIPIAKHHGLSNVTLSMKNLMGLIGGRRDLLHQKLPECIVDLTAYFKPSLHVLDAVRVLRANGPQGSTLRDVIEMNTVAASPDPVKIDAFGISLFENAGFDNNLSQFPHIRLAEQKGLGTPDFRGAGFQEFDLG